MQQLLTVKAGGTGTCSCRWASEG